MNFRYFMNSLIKISKKEKITSNHILLSINSISSKINPNSQFMNKNLSVQSSYHHNNSVRGVVPGNKTGARQ